MFHKEKGRSIPLKIKMGEPKVEINVSDIALETVKKLLEKDKNKKGIYVYLAGIGCGGGGSASYSLAPVEQEEGENVVIIDGIPFIYDNLMLKHTDKISIDYKPSAYGNEIWLEQFTYKGCLRGKGKGSAPCHVNTLTDWGTDPFSIFYLLGSMR